MNNKDVVFRYSVEAVTDNSPSLLPGSFTFDSKSLALYIDTDTQRVQVKDPLKLSLTGGDLTGDVQVLDSDGTVTAVMNTLGVVQGKYLETTGNIALDTAPNLYAVIDSTGRIRTRTRAQMVQDLGIVDPDSLGALAYVDSAISEYTPEGTVSKPIVTVNSNTESVIKSITSGNPSSYNVEGEVLSLVEGTKTTFTSTEAIKNITSVDVTQPIFTGTKATITVNPNNKA